MKEEDLSQKLDCDGLLTLKRTSPVALQSIFFPLSIPDIPLLLVVFPPPEIFMLKQGKRGLR